MFNPIRAVLDGYYPTERDLGGAYDWMLTTPHAGAIFPSSRDAFEAGEFRSDEGKHVGPFTPKNASFVFSSDTGSWGGGPIVPNQGNTGANTAYGINLDGDDHDTMFRGDNLFNWTFAAVLKHFLFPNSLWNQQVFRIQRIFIGAYDYIRIHMNSVYGFRVSLDHGAFLLDAPPNNDAANDPGRGTRWVVTYESDDDELRIYQDGVLAASGIFAMTVPVVSGGLTTVLWGGHGKALDSFSGFFGATSFQDRCWTPHQVAAWSADPWGQYRPIYRYSGFIPVPGLLTANLGMSPAVASDMDMGPGVRADLYGAPAVVADRDMGPAVESNLETGPAVAADLATDEET